MTLNHSVIHTPEVEPGGELVLLTAWEQEARPQTVKLFIHLIAPDGQTISQWDGLGAAWEGWRTGFTLYQLHRLTIPPDAPPGTYQLWAGLYHPDTLQRWTTPADPDGRVLLGQITIANNE